MNAKLTFSAPAILAAYEAAVNKGLGLVVLKMQIELRKMLNRKGSGRVYRGGLAGKGMYRQRSAGGEPPSPDTGTLRNSAQVARSIVTTDKGKSITHTMFGFRVGIDQSVTLPLLLERGSSRMAARPFVAPTIDIVRPMAVQIIDEQLEICSRSLRTQGAL